MNNMNKKMLTTLFIVIGLAVLLIVLFRTDKKREPIKITAYSSMEELTLDELITKADLIVVGQAKTVYPSRWNTPNGKLPDGVTTKNLSTKNIIFTDLNFLVSQTIKGENGASVLIRTFGGQVDQDIMTISPVESLETGQVYLLFLSRDNTGLTASIDPSHYLVLGSIQGTYKVSDGKAISFRDEWQVEKLIDYIQKIILEKNK